MKGRRKECQINMNKSNTLRLIELIESTSNFNTFIKVLNLDLNSSFLCLLDVLKQTILTYNSIYDYREF